MNQKQLDRMTTGKGFIAALDQSGGSTPKALKAYGIPKTRYRSDEQMFDLVHEMRTRIIKSPSFTSDKILAAILFENTMDRKIDDQYTADYLWNVKGIIPILKVDKGLDKENNGVQLMKPMPELDSLLSRAKTRHIFGTKMRSVIHKADKGGIKAIADQQFDIAKRIVAAGFVPIIEPEVDINAPDKAEAEALLHAEFKSHLAALEDGDKVMFKVTIPTEAGLYSDIMKDPHVVRVVALSGGYTRKDACVKLAKNPGLIASFSRALTEGLTCRMNDKDFDYLLGDSIDKIYQASIK
ncbi:fructose bisphosphate aldolase [Pseudoramibacter sp.]|jgi:fructose-bisphosphate aldolase class I|uniref:fructose bisphosphate aldolase n=1 Tax=Pseudoramibacter sp. TaxID=2034862 RepID=UPI0025D3CEBB|nr:fructose bisphosphate aldolase [Pseudoramibacter sp.]MCH4071641.1 fructose bisphosphate aldolase [Pseudoramibacter sp.]MCH4105409.1 fructose bisphosphate aldolase [Pseudoramibacter sp.]